MSLLTDFGFIAAQLKNPSGFNPLLPYCNWEQNTQKWLGLSSITGRAPVLKDISVYDVFTWIWCSSLVKCFFFSGKSGGILFPVQPHHLIFGALWCLSYSELLFLQIILLTWVFREGISVWFFLCLRCLNHWPQQDRDTTGPSLTSIEPAPLVLYRGRSLFKIRPGIVEGVPVPDRGLELGDL